MIVAAAARGLVLSALLLAGYGCGDEEPEPVRVARAYASAVQRGDTQAVLDLVESRLAERVQQAAERASDQVGGRRTIGPEEMLQIVDVDPRFQVRGVELVSDDGSRATVRLVGADATTTELELVNEDGQWHVVVPLPAGPANAEP